MFMTSFQTSQLNITAATLNADTRWTVYRPAADETCRHQNSNHLKLTIRHKVVYHISSRV